MTKAAAKTTVPAAKPTQESATTKAPASLDDYAQQLQRLNVGRELLDTTWRMTVPVVIFAAIGIFADIRLHSKPWLTLVGAVIGFGFAAALVKRQIARSEDQDKGDKKV